MLSGETCRAADTAGTAVFRIVVSSDSMKKATATSQGSNRLLEAAGGPDGFDGLGGPEEFGEFDRLDEFADEVIRRSESSSEYATEPDGNLLARLLPSPIAGCSITIMPAILTSLFHLTRSSKMARREKAAATPSTE